MRLELIAIKTSEIGCPIDMLGWYCRSWPHLLSRMQLTSGMCGFCFYLSPGWWRWLEIRSFSCPAKVMERAMSKYIHIFFLNYLFFFYKYQDGFYQVTKQHMNLLNHMILFYSIYIDEGKSCCMIFCDIPKAFDRIWHKRVYFFQFTIMLSTINNYDPLKVFSNIEHNESYVRTRWLCKTRTCRSSSR